MHLDVIDLELAGLWFTKTVELMPVHHHNDEGHLIQKGLNNYWGYNTLVVFRA